MIDKDYELIKRYKTTTPSLNNSQIDLSQINEVISQDKGYFGIK